MRRTWRHLLIAFATLALPIPGTAQESRFTARPLAADGQHEAAKLGSRSDLVSVIVKLESDSLAGYRGGVRGLAATSPKVTRRAIEPHTSAGRAYLAFLDREHRAFEEALFRALPEGRAVHRYSVVLSGLSVLVPRDKIDVLKAVPGVRAVYRDELLKPVTERSTTFVGSNQLWNSLGGRNLAGEGTVVGILDSGIWPEHPSFSDPDPSGIPFPTPPTPPGVPCDFGNTAYNPSDSAFTCNNKLIGARKFLATYKAVIGLLPEEFDSARDDNGHGTHTASTAAGNSRVPASVLGVPRGKVSGVAPRAHVIAYRVCADQGCFISDSMAAVQQAILDGVNVINFSISGGSSPFSDGVELAFLDAYDAGVFVAASAGNAGPTPDSVSHRGPWTMTVAASTTDRHFLSDVTLTGDPGGYLLLTGATVTDGIAAATPVVFPPAGPGNDLCLNPFPPGTFSGEIVICRRGTNARVAKGFNVAAGGASGMLLYNPTLQGLATDNHFIPSVHLENDAGAQLLAFMSSHTNVQATFTSGVASKVQGDVMAAFSSRGGPGQSLGISKPDVTAPGVQILAGHTPMPATVGGGLPGELFQVIQGTSMSGPHVAGAAALLKDLHPSWTPGEIKSALMTTARRNVTKEDGVTKANAFDYGSGRIDLKKAGQPGITFSENGAGFLGLETHLWDANYPSLYVPANPGSITVERTAKSQLPYLSTWTTKVEAPSDLEVIVPAQIQVPANGQHTFEINVDARSVPAGATRFANIRFKFASFIANFPITIVKRDASVVLDKTCAPTDLLIGDNTSCAIAFQNTSFSPAMVNLVDALPFELDLIEGSVSGATPVGNHVVFDGVLDGPEPPDVSVGPGASPAGGYLPLSMFGIPATAGFGDETIVNFNVPPFQYGGETWTRIGVVSNGYLVVGGGTSADVDFVNQSMPDPDRPNNVLAPFWTDLNPGAAGALRVAILTDGTNDWIVFDWEAVRNYSNPATNSFEVWIGVNGVEDISYAYGPVTAGDGGFLTVGAENKFGNRGDNHYFDGAGSLPVDGTQLVVTSVPGTPAPIHTITFDAQGVAKGAWENCAELASDAFPGRTVIDCVSGEVTPP